MDSKNLSLKKSPDIFLFYDHFKSLDFFAKFVENQEFSTFDKNDFLARNKQIINNTHNLTVLRSLLDNF